MDDRIIIGGGVIGLSIAYELARAGRNVRVLERGQLGKEASWAGAGILPPANRDTAVDPLDQLRGMGHQLHPQWAKHLLAETGIDNGYRQCGGIYLARDQGEAESLREMADCLHQEGIHVEPLSDEQVVHHEPALRPLVESGHCVAAFRMPQEAQLRNPDHLRALAIACQQRGVKCETDCQVNRIVDEKGRITRVETSQGEFSGEQFCITSGAWSTLLLRDLHVSNRIVPIRGQMVLFKCAQTILTHVINEGSRYIVPRDDGRVLVGSSEEDVGFTKGTTKPVIGELSQLAYDLVPALKKAPIEQTWSGLRPATFDRYPYLGKIPGLDNAFVAAGHFRSGLYLSPSTAVVMSQLMQGIDPVIDLTPFSLERG